MKRPPEMEYATYRQLKRDIRDITKAISKGIMVWNGKRGTFIKPKEKKEYE